MVTTEMIFENAQGKVAKMKLVKSGIAARWHGLPPGKTSGIVRTHATPDVYKVEWAD